MSVPFDPSAYASPAERGAALEALAATAPPQTAVEAAAACLADADPGVRERAARVITGLGGAAAARAVVPHIASRDIRVRNLAGEVLAGLGDAAVEALAPAVEDPDKDVRKFAIDVLALLPAHALTDRIAARLDDEDGNVVLAAVDALGALDPTPYAERLRALYAADALARPSVIAALAAEAHGDAETLDLFEAALGDEDPVVQFSAAEALAAQQAPSALDRLAALVPDVPEAARPLVLEAVVRLLGTVPERAPAFERLRPYLVAMLDDLDPAYRRAAVEGLALVGAGALDVAIVDALLTHAGADDALDVAIFGVVAGHPDALHRLFHLTREGRMTPDTASNFVLGLLAQGSVDEALWPEAAAFIGSYFGGFDADTKLAAIDLSQRLQHPALHAVIEAGLADFDPTVRSFAADAALDAGLDAAPAAHRALA